jgi:hypothetical protein
MANCTTLDLIHLYLYKILPQEENALIFLMIV